MTNKKKRFYFLAPKTEIPNKNESINVRFARAVKIFLINEAALQELFAETHNNPDFNPSYVSCGRSLLEMSIYKFNISAAEFL